MKLTKAQRHVLAGMGDGPGLRNGDESSPMWWMPGRVAVHHKVAESLVRHGLVEYCAHWGGHPGILGFRITPAGRAALQEGE